MEHGSQFTEHFPYIGLFILLILGGIGLSLLEDTTLMLCGFLISQEVMCTSPPHARKRIYGAARRRHDSLSALQ